MLLPFLPATYSLNSPDDPGLGREVLAVGGGISAPISTVNSPWGTRGHLMAVVRPLAVH